MLKLIHLTAVFLSISGFILRGIWMLRESPLLQQKWVRVLPHLIDTLLLSSALALAITYGLHAFIPPWLIAKFIALLAYILLGMVALRYGKTQRQKLIAWLAALMVFAYIVLVALTKSPTLQLNF